MQRRTLIATAAVTVVAGLAAGLGGCASMQQFTAEVASFGDWPAGRKPGSYAFERLPSQQTQPEAQQRIEDAARTALEHAGFTPAAPGAEPDVLVQVGAHVDRTDPSPWDDPLWWHGGFGSWRRGPWRGGPYWGLGMRWDSPRYEREVALLLRDRASGRPLYETRASSEGYNRTVGALLLPLFDAALKDFPATGPNPRQVTVPLP